MKKIILPLLLSISCLAGGRLHGQALGINLVTGPTTIMDGSFDTVVVMVVNRDTVNALVNSDIWIHVTYLDTMGGVVMPPFFLDTTTINNVTIPAGDSIMYVWTDTFSVVQPQYQMGGNTVVIWPLAPQDSSYTKDSLFHNYIIVPNSINEPQWSGYGNIVLYAYPNPFSNRFQVNVGELYQELIALDLLDLHGRLIQSFGKSLTAMPKSLSAGSYLLRARFTNERHKTFMLQHR